jgi:hypothetical protein
MPTIANPRPYHGQSRARPAPTHGSLTEAVRTRIHETANRGAFTRALAAGADPLTQPELAPRAAQLISRRERATIARSLGRTMQEAHSSSPTYAAPALIRRGAVRDAEDVIAAVISRLEGPHPVSPRGMAQIQRLLTNADPSPLYNDAAPGALRRAMSAVLCALEPDRGFSPDHGVADPR